LKTVIQPNATECAYTEQAINSHVIVFLLPPRRASNISQEILSLERYMAINRQCLILHFACTPSIVLSSHKTFGMLDGHSGSTVAQRWADRTTGYSAEWKFRWLRTGPFQELKFEVSNAFG
jgi:hypothetical protein